LQFINSSFLDFEFSFGLDGISIYFFILTTFLTFLSIIFIWDESDFKFYSILLLILELLLLLCFSILNIFLFYVCFECILIPMYLIIGVWGSREKKIRAAYLLFFYTIFCSVLMLASIICIYLLTGTCNLQQLIYYNFSFDQQILFWLSFFISFASKVPMFPFHIWLPEAHVEAPTVGSVLLAGILLKLGVYGFLRYSLMLFPQACIYFSPLIYVLCLIGVIFTSILAIKQTDLKKIIAYSSIAHMNLVVLGVFSGNILGVEASILQSVSHGYVSSALFFLIGMMYNRYHSRLLYYYGGLVYIMPLYSSFFLFFTLSNIALPGTSSFVGEFLLLLGLFQENFFCAILAGTSVILSGAYSLWLYNRIVFGNFKSKYLELSADISFREFFILSSLFVVSLHLGLFSFNFLNIIHFSVVKLFIFTNVIAL
jgi:proton-translocating NADH-quinone oxidoreductase chain M